MRVITIFNPDNLPVKDVLVYGKKGIVLPEGATVLFDDEPAFGKMERIPHIEIAGKEYKWCGKCHRWLRVYEYYKNIYSPDGLTWRCADCTLIDRKKYWITKRNKKYGKFI
jgi:hypothetical protein